MHRHISWIEHDKKLMQPIGGQQFSWLIDTARKQLMHYTTVCSLIDTRKISNFTNLEPASLNELLY